MLVKCLCFPTENKVSHVIRGESIQRIKSLISFFFFSKSTPPDQIDDTYTSLNPTIRFPEYDTLNVGYLTDKINF